MNNPFRGLGTALITPFTSEGSVDYDCLASLTERQIASGVDFLCVLGTTAETPTLSNDEKLRIMQTVASVNAGRVPLLLGAGGNCTHQVCQWIRETNLSAYQGLLIVAPYYNKPSQEGLFQHFKAVSAASPLPLILYNIPGRTGVNISPDIVLRLIADSPNIVGIKEASGNRDQISRLLRETPDYFGVISGDDGIALSLMREGAVGAISVISNAFPRDFKAVVDKGDEAAEQRLRTLVRLTMADGNPAGIKRILHALQLCPDILRLPLVSVCREVADEIDAQVGKYQ